VPVTQDEHSDWNPVWSPDGRYLCCGSNRGDSMNSWRVPIDEATGRTLGPPEAITTGAGNTMFLKAAADGRTFAYVAKQDSRNLQRIPFDFDPIAGEPAGEPVPATRGRHFFTWPSPSPDGERIVATRRAGQEDLYLVNRDGSDRRQPTNDAAKDRGTSWSPDGEEITYYSHRSRGSYEYIWMMTLQ